MSATPKWLTDTQDSHTIYAMARASLACACGWKATPREPNRPALYAQHRAHVADEIWAEFEKRFDWKGIGR